MGAWRLVSLPLWQTAADLGLVSYPEPSREIQVIPLGRSITASPAVADQCLVIGTTDGFLCCLGKKE